MNDKNSEYFERTAEGMAPGYVYRSDAEARAALGIEDDDGKPFRFGPFCAECVADADDCTDCPEADTDAYAANRLEFEQAYNRERHAEETVREDALLPPSLSRTATNERARRSRPTLRAFDHHVRPGCGGISCTECGMTLDECMGFHLYVATVTQAEDIESAQVQPGCMGTLCSECRTGDEDCAEYQDFLHSEGYGARPAMTAQVLEIAGALTPRCDY